MREEQPGQIGRYRILGELGRGGFGRVYRGYDPVVGRPVAVKILTQVSEDNLTRFRNEAVVAGKLGHRNIVTVYEYGSHEGLPFLAMEYLEGQDLHQIISSRTPLSLLRKCKIMSEVAEGLHCAHQSGVVHRDMKPGNIMVLRDGNVKIMDFGIARLTGKADATRLTQRGYLVGTLRYMAPEQLAGAEFDPLCDIFAYGVVFYELLAGRHPFEAPDAQNLMYRLTFEEPPPIREFARDVPEPLQEVIFKIIQKNRARRYQSLREVQYDTEPIRIDLQNGHVSQLLKRAQGLVAKGEFEPAQAMVHDALSLDPSNRTARMLREQLKEQLERRAPRPLMEPLMDEGEKYLAQRRFADAVRAFERALALDPGNSSVQARIESARSLEEQASRASELLAEARRELGERNITAAYRNVSLALRHDPKNPEAAEFLKKLQAYVEGRQAEQRVDEAIRKAQGLILIPDYDGAIASLMSGSQDLKSPRLLEFLERVQAERLAFERKERLRQAIAKATDLLRDHRLEAAVPFLERLQREFPEDREISQLLAYAQREQGAVARAKAVESVTSEARARAESQDFDGALAALDRALKEYPDESGLIRLLNNTLAAKDAWEAQQAIQSIAASCEALRSKRRFSEAVQALEGALRKYAAEPVLRSLLEQVQAEWAEHRRSEAIRHVCGRAEVLLRQMEPEAALRMVQQALTRYPGETALTGLLQRAEDAMRAQERTQAVAAIGSEAARLSAANEFERALQILDQGLKRWHDEPDLIRQRAATLEANVSWDRQVQRAAAIERLTREARVQADGGNFDGALALLDQGLQNWPDAASLREMRDAALVARECGERRKQALRDLKEIWRSSLGISDSAEPARLLTMALNIASQHPGDEEIQGAAAQPIALLSDITEARAELVQSNFQTVLDICERYLAQHPNHVAFGELKRDVLRARRRAHVTEYQLRAAAEPELPRRAAILQEILQQYPDEAAIQDELRLTQNKLALIESIVGRARAAEATGLWTEALAQWSSLLTIYEQYPGLSGHIERARLAQQEAAEHSGNAGRADSSRLVVLPKQVPLGQEGEEEGEEPGAAAPGADPRNRRRRRTLLPLIGAGAVLSSGIYITNVLRRPRDIAVSIESALSGASVSVGGKSCVTPNCTLNLKPGTYTLQASANGHQAITRQFTLEASQTAVRVPIVLAPLPQILQVSTDFEGGQVYLDGRLARELEGSRYTVSGLNPGRHTLRVAASGATFEAEWTMAAGAPPELLRLDAGKDLEATVVASAGATGTIACGCVSQAIRIDGVPAAELPAAPGSPVNLIGLQQGTHQIEVGDRSLVVDLGPNPTLNVFLSLDRNLGLLIVKTNEASARVFLNNHLYRRPVVNGMLRIPVQAGEYSVRVERDGVRSPEPQTVVLKKGEEKLVSFAMASRTAELQIGGSLAGVQVKVDGQVVGETDRTGRFQHSLAPGGHNIELTKEGYAPLQLTQQFLSGKAVQLSRDQVAMVAAPKSAQPDFRQIEAQDWARIATSSNPDDFERFVRNHPGSTHGEQARARTAELRQLLQANAARQAEQAAWSGVDQDNREQLQNHLSRFPAGLHAQEARTRIADLERQSEALAAQHLREQRDAERAKKSADEQTIAKVLRDFEEAYNRKDLAELQRLWGGVPIAAYRQQFREATSLTFRLQIVGQLVLNGDSAVATCTRTLTYQGRSGPPQSHNERVYVTLNRDSSGWRIHSINAY